MWVEDERSVNVLKTHYHHDSGVSGWRVRVNRLNHIETVFANKVHITIAAHRLNIKIREPKLDPFIQCFHVCHVLILSWWPSLAGVG